MKLGTWNLKLPSWCFSPLYVAVWSVALHAAGMTYALLRQEWDVSGFVFLGHRMPWANDPAFDPVTRRFAPSGYDGQAYYAVARQPFGDNRVRLDYPVRHARILYPLACHLVSGGDGRALLWVMPLLNLLAIGAITWLAARYARWRGLSAWWGLLLPLMLNALVPAVRNLTDAFAMLAAFALVVGWERRWSPVTMGLMAAAAVLSREQNAAVVAVVLAAAAWRRRWWLTTAVAVGGATLLAWMTYLRSVYGEWPVMPAAGNVGGPLDGVRHWYDFNSRNDEEWLLRVVYAAFVLGCTAGLLWRLTRDRAVTAAAVVGWGGVALVAVAGPAITDDFWAYSRAFFWLPLATWVTNVRAGCRPALAVGFLSVAFPRGTLNVL